MGKKIIKYLKISSLLTFIVLAMFLVVTFAIGDLKGAYLNYGIQLFVYVIEFVIASMIIFIIIIAFFDLFLLPIVSELWQSYKTSGYRGRIFIIFLFIMLLLRKIIMYIRYD